jgi:hypothetical protein
MKKEYVSYGLIGIIAGLVLGFIVGNWASPTGGAAPQAAAPAEAKPASVNSSNSGQSLPPGHPPLDSGQTIPAPPLPEGATAAAPAAPAAQAGETTELPSLDPLPPGSKEERAEQKYKNIQLLRGIPAERLTKIMFSFKASLGVDCTYCHIKDQFEKDDKAAKQVARKMIQLVRDTNAKLGSMTRVTCFTCHRGQTRPAS